MSLYEEYLNRHSIDIPVILYNNNTNVYVANDYTPVPRRFSITWYEQESHPGYFVFSYCELIHNGFESERLAREFIDSGAIYWDHYEGMVKKYVNLMRNDGFRAVSEELQEIASWQGYLTVIDSFLSKEMDTDFFNLVGQSLCSSLSLDVRLEAIESAIDKISDISPSLCDMWFDEFLPVNNNNSWLVKLING